MTTKIKKLSERRAKLRDQIAEAVKEEFPLGSKVRATLGGHEIRGTVVRHGYRADAVFFTNDRTGKEREANATYDGHDLTRID